MSYTELLLEALDAKKDFEEEGTRRNYERLRAAIERANQQLRREIRNSSYQPDVR